MQKLPVLFVAVAFSYTFASAQHTHTLIASVTRTKHNVAVAGDKVAKGQFYYKNPDRMCMTFNEGKDMLLMDGIDFILINDGKSSVAGGKEAAHLAILQRVLQNIILGIDTEMTNSEIADITRTDNTICITPNAAGTKAARRLMFTSFTLTVDPKTAALKSMRMNEKGGNYTQYDFAGCVVNATVDEEVFSREKR